MSVLFAFRNCVLWYSRVFHQPSGIRITTKHVAGSCSPTKRLLSASEGTSCASGPARGNDWIVLISTARDRAGSALPNKILNVLVVIAIAPGSGSAWAMNSSHKPQFQQNSGSSPCSIPWGKMPPRSQRQRSRRNDRDEQSQPERDPPIISVLEIHPSLHLGSLPLAVRWSVYRTFL